MLKKRIYTVVALLLLSVALFSASFDGRYAEVVSRVGIENKLAVYFVDLDVPEGSKDKSGDAQIIISPDNKVILLDCGHPDSYKNTMAVLDTLGITTIDMFINSHPHIDHLGAFPFIADKYEIKEVVRSEVEYPSSSYYRAFLESIEKHKIKDTIVKTGDLIEFGSKVKIEVLNPDTPIVYPDNYPKGSTQFLNNNSLALKFIYGDTVYLTCGDLYLNGEKDVLEKYPESLKADLLKANHHLNDTSSQLRWVKATKAQVVVGMNDVIGSMSVYKRYVKYGATVYHTLYNGMIRVVCEDNHNLTVTTQLDSWVEKGGN